MRSPCMCDLQKQSVFIIVLVRLISRDLRFLPSLVMATAMQTGHRRHPNLRPVILMYISRLQTLCSDVCILHLSTTCVQE